MGGNRTVGGRVCPQGMIFPILDESGWNPAVRGALYFFALAYCFVGVSVVTGVFMGAVLTITTKTKKVYLPKSSVRQAELDDSMVASPILQETDFVEVRVWNDTVAHLTLMALGTSAPEIMLACIEIVGHDFESGELGPGTIVGSAALNLLMITAICLMSIPRKESRRIGRFKVFLVCSFFSIFAYVWMWFVLSLVSPSVVELWEAIITFLLFPGLVFSAYATDKGLYGLTPFGIRGNRELEMEHIRRQESEKMRFEKELFRDGKIDRERLIAFVREIKKYSSLTDEDAALLAASKIIDSQPRSNVYYRIGAVRNLTGDRKLGPKLSARLQEVYNDICEHLATPNVDHLPEISSGTHTIVEFHAATCAVQENIGSFPVNVCRHGNLEPVVIVRVESVDGSAKAGEDFVKVNEELVFKSGETEKHVLVQIIDDNRWEPDEEFFLKLSLVEPADNDRVRLGKISIMEVTIVDDDKPGVISFRKKGVLVKESAKVLVLKVGRKFGADGEVSVKWRTIDGTAISGRDYVAGEGELVFKHREVLKTIEIQIINDMKVEKDEHFFVELFSPSNNASLGKTKRTCVTITNDDAFTSIVDKMMALTTANLEALTVSRKTWAAQVKGAMNVNGGDLATATAADYALHFISFNWKLMFSLIPPPNFLGGWLCFWVSLAAIGAITAVVGDLAAIFGCVVGLRDSTTAITVLALGTSLPDTFASRAAALREANADTSVGNITGSNSVNVFLGLGLPWLIATIYHANRGTSFRVPTETLNFSVVLFLICAVTTIALLIVRRNSALAGNAELGGPRLFKLLSGGFLIFLWLIYVLLSCLQEYEYITVNF